MKPILKKDIDVFRKGLSKDTDLLSSAITKNGIESVTLNRESVIALQNTFSHEVKTGKITNQEKSGRCWMFAGTNLFRHRVEEKCNLENFELSQSYPMFWDKLEKANYFLESMIATREMSLDSRLIMWLLANPLQDGGQWDMFASLVEKYGVVPKYEMPGTFDTSDSRAMNQLLTRKLRQQAITVREKPADKKKMLSEFYGMLVKFFGKPPERFDFEYRDKKERFHRDAGLTPREFFTRYVGLDLNNFVSVINAPTRSKPFGKMYTIRYLGNVAEGKRIMYFNVKNSDMKSMAIAQLKSGMPVWFGCDVMKMMEMKTGLMDSKLFLFEDAFGTDLKMKKGDSLDYGESKLNHAMLFTGVNMVGNKPNRWKIENSWGDEKGQKGYFVMGDEWFDQYAFQAVIHKKFIPEKFKKLLKQKPVELEPWDPLGSLALMM